MPVFAIILTICVTLTICLWLVLTHRLEMAKLWTHTDRPVRETAQHNVPLEALKLVSVPAREEVDSAVVAVIPPPPSELGTLSIEEPEWTTLEHQFINGKHVDIGCPRCDSRKQYERYSPAGPSTEMHNPWSPNCKARVQGEPMHPEATCFICEPEMSSSSG